MQLFVLLLICWIFSCMVCFFKKTIDFIYEYKNLFLSMMVPRDI